MTTRLPSPSGAGPSDEPNLGPQAEEVRYVPADIQRLAISGHGEYPAAVLLFFHVVDPGSVRGFLERIASEVSTLAPDDRPTRLQVALSASGLRALGVDSDTLKTFALEFVLGMERRAHVNGDDPAEIPRWSFGGSDKRVDLALLLYGRSPGALAMRLRGLRRQHDLSGVRLVAAQRTLCEARGEGATRKEVVEHFGFRDGIVQPNIERKQPGGERAPLPEDGTPGPDAGAPVPFGEVVLGYKNGYAYRTIGPSVDARLDPNDLLEPYPARGRRDLGANGTYLVIRKLEQDVAGFWRTVSARAKDMGVTSEWLAARMVGRWKNGSAVVDYPDAPGPPPDPSSPGISFAGDPHAYRCPRGSHIRRTNPRDDLGEDIEQSLMVVGRHRMHRRGRIYGPRLADPAADDGRRRGLVFMAVGTSIRRQFEFVQNVWMTSTCFNGLHGEDDPLVGPRAPHYFDDGEGSHATQTSPFSIPTYPVRRCAAALPRFVSMRGGEYFFLPSVRALRFLSRLRGA